MIAVEVEKKLPKVMALCQKHKVKTLYIFGSAVTSHFNKKSDVDLLITFKNTVSMKNYAANFFSFQGALEKVFSRKIDLTEEPALSNRYFIEAINDSKVKVYEA